MLLFILVCSLVNCFVVEKLLELLNKWTSEPAKREETKVACAIIEIFHLLPVAAIKFLGILLILHCFVLFVLILF